MPLINIGQYQLHSGSLSKLKIDCSVWPDEEWNAIAALIYDLLPPFSQVEGIPTGGLKLAAALAPYCRHSFGWVDPALLIVDDVYTSGKSMEEQRRGRDANGFVVFARTLPPPWIRWFLLMNGDIE